MSLPSHVARCPTCDLPATYVLDEAPHRFVCVHCKQYWGLRKEITYYQAVAALHRARQESV